MMYIQETQWLRRCATTRKAAGSISDEAIDFPHLPKFPNDPILTLALRLPRPLTETNTSNLLGKQISDGA
jgi:hypothetical protein